jgi:hypothetical protein
MQIDVREEKFIVLMPQMEKHEGYTIYGKEDPHLILIHPDLEAEGLMEACIHEFRHAFNPDDKEDVVLEFGSQLTKFLVAMGFRHVPEGHEVTRVKNAEADPD